MTIKRKYKPVGFRVLVKLKKVSQEKEKMSEGGIVIAVKTQSKINLEQRATQEAYVIDIGESAFKGFDDGKPWCKVGDLVLISKYSGDDLDDAEDDEIYRIINDRDIEATIEEV